MSTTPSLATGQTFTASRWTRGNHFFPTRIVVSPLHVSRVKRRFFGNTEESISISQVASVEISSGIIWSEVKIESTGGAGPPPTHPHHNRDTIRPRALIETFPAPLANTPAYVPAGDSQLRWVPFL